MEKNELLKLDNQLCFALYASSRAMTKMYRPLLKELGLTYPQYLVMLVVWEEDNRTVNEIGELLHLDSGTLTPLLKRLESADLIKRERSGYDERKVFISLTGKGSDLKEQAVTIPEELFCHSGLSMEEFLQLKNQLNDLLKKMKKFTCEE
ncbi:MAG: MarR family transcriptional regulator [bacterium]|nr:MarR family transcriptional regulator [bacterium]